MKKLILWSLLILCFQGYSQIAVKKDFNNTEWFTDDDDFRIKDTIVIKRMLHYETDYKTLSRGHVIAYNNRWRNTLIINFSKKEIANLYTIKVELCGMNDIEDNWKWNFDESLQVLDLYLNNTLKTSFNIINKTYKKESWNYEIDNGTQTSFYTHMIAIQLVKIQKPAKI